MAIRPPVEIINKQVHNSLKPQGDSTQFALKMYVILCSVT